MFEKFIDQQVKNLHKIKGGSLDDEGYVPKNNFKKYSVSTELTTTNDSD